MLLTLGLNKTCAAGLGPGAMSLSYTDSHIVALYGPVVIISYWVWVSMSFSVLELQDWGWSLGLCSKAHGNLPAGWQAMLRQFRVAPNFVTVVPLHATLSHSCGLQQRSTAASHGILHNSALSLSPT